jgi:hypothetical protein
MSTPTPSTTPYQPNLLGSSFKNSEIRGAGMEASAADNLFSQRDVENLEYFLHPDFHSKKPEELIFEPREPTTRKTGKKPKK